MHMMLPIDRLSRSALCSVLLLFAPASAGPHPLDDPRITALLQNLAGSPEQAGAAAEHLVSIGAPAVPALALSLRHANPQVRYFAAWILGELVPTVSTAAPALREALGDDSYEVRLCAATGLASSKNATEAIVPALVNGVALAPQPETREGIIQLLGALGPKAAAAIPAIAAALKDPTPSVRGVVPRALVRMGPGAVVYLCQALRHQDYEVRLFAARGLRELGSKATDAIPPLSAALRDESIAGDAARALGDIGPESTGVLIAALADVNLVNREGAGAENLLATIANILGERGPSAVTAVPGIQRLLCHKSSYVRLVAAMAIGNIGPGAHAAMPTLSKLASDPSEGVRQEAKKALAKVGSE